MTDHSFDKFLDFIFAGMMAGFGGIASYLFNMLKRNDPFRLSSFMLNAFLAFFLGNMIGSFIPMSYAYRDGILMLSGFSTWPVLSLLEIYTSKFAEKFIKNKMGLEESALKNPEDIRMPSQKKEEK